MPHGMEVGIGPGFVVAEGDPAPPKKGQSSPHCSAHFAMARSLISAAAEQLFVCMAGDKISAVIEPHAVALRQLSVLRIYSPFI